MAKSAAFRRTLTEEFRDPKFAAEYHAELARLRIAEQLARARQAAGLTQGQLAGRIGTSQPAVARMERGSYQGHTIKVLAKAAHALGRRLHVELVQTSRPMSVVYGARVVKAAKVAAKKKR